MSKLVKILGIAMVLAVILIVSVTGAAFAGNSYGGSELCDGDPVADHDQHQFGK